MDKPYGYMKTPVYGSPVDVADVTLNLFIKHLRVDHGMTEYEICHALGMSERRLAQIEMAAGG